MPKCAFLENEIRYPPGVLLGYAYMEFSQLWSTPIWIPFLWDCNKPIFQHWFTIRFLKITFWCFSRWICCSSVIRCSASASDATVACLSVTRLTLFLSYLRHHITRVSVPCPFISAHSHLNALGSGADSAGRGTNAHPQYACPRCRAAYCELPIECTVCGLTLVAAPHLARAYHHLFPLENFEVVSPRDSSSEPSNVTGDGGTKSVSTSANDEVWCAGCAVRLPKTLPVSNGLIKHLVFISTIMALVCVFSVWINDLHLFSNNCTVCCLFEAHHTIKKSNPWVWRVQSIFCSSDTVSHNQTRINPVALGHFKVFVYL